MASEMKWELRIHSRNGPVVATSYDGSTFVSKKEGTYFARITDATMSIVDGSIGRIEGVVYFSDVDEMERPAYWVTPVYPADEPSPFDILPRSGRRVHNRRSGAPLG